MAAEQKPGRDKQKPGVDYGMIQDRAEYAEDELKAYDRGWRRGADGRYYAIRNSMILDHIPQGVEINWGAVIPVTRKTPEERQKQLHNAAMRTAEVVGKRRTCQELAQAAMRCKASQKLIDKAIDNGVAAGDIPDGVTMGDLIALSQAAHALDNDKSAVYIRDTAGDKPTDVQQVQTVTDADMELVRKLAARLGIND